MKPGLGEFHDAAHQPLPGPGASLASPRSPRESGPMDRWEEVDPGRPGWFDNKGYVFSSLEVAVLGCFMGRVTFSRIL